MNSIDYSKAQFSRAKTADYLPGQSLSGPFYNPNMAHSNHLGQSLPRSQVYEGDASRYFISSRHPQPNYQQYGYRLANSYQNIQPNPYVIESQHMTSRQPQSAHFIPHQHATNRSQVQLPTQTQLPTRLNEQSRQFVQQSQAPSTYQRQFLNFRPMMSYEINQVPQSRIPLSQRTSEPLHNYDFKVFCPACHQEYYNSQLEEHVERHLLYNADQFKVQSAKEAHDFEEDTEAESGPKRLIYPLVFPQQFDCKALNDVNFVNKEKSYQMNQSNIKTKSEVATQFSKPPLQIRSNNTDIYNCFDNIFSSKNEFSVDDLTQNNTILAKKRQLEEWEKVNSQKEGYSIKKKSFF